MRQYNTFAQTEALLLTAITLPGSSIKSIAAATGIQANTLYKCIILLILYGIAYHYASFRRLISRLISALDRSNA